ncbi:acyl-coenzyme A diphosphatase FITM2-like [Penaeus indicus]|uniref:acyl-coenzyme A diphosphatase FITM2-like n=1 Tax=Penaeus indicus TaxID=29960 RepID=UPI00300C0C27
MCYSGKALQELEAAQTSIKQPKSLPLLERIATLGISYLHIPPKHRIFYFIFVVLFMSFMGDSVEIPHLLLLTGKKSTLNQVFVKLGWAWTFSSFGIFNLLSLLIHKDWIKRMKCFAVRLAVTTFFFYLWCTVTFPTIERYTGSCVHKGISLNFTKRECVKRPEHEYISFDISGHSFLLIYCIMIIMEESKDILYFLQLSRHFRGAPTIEGKEAPGKEVKNLEKVFKIMSPLIILALLSMVALSLLWDFMLIITTIYYHSLSEKLLGTVLSLGMWYILYKRIFIVLHEIL